MIRTYDQTNETRHGDLLGPVHPCTGSIRITPGMKWMLNTRGHSPSWVGRATQQWPLFLFLTLPFHPGPTLSPIRLKNCRNDNIWTGSNDVCGWVCVFEPGRGYRWKEATKRVAKFTQFHGLLAQKNESNLTVLLPAATSIKPWDVITQSDICLSGVRVYV